MKTIDSKPTAKRGDRVLLDYGGTVRWEGVVTAERGPRFVVVYFARQGVYHVTAVADLTILEPLEA